MTRRTSGTALTAAGIIGLVLGLSMLVSGLFYTYHIPPFAWFVPFMVNGPNFPGNVAIGFLFWVLYLGLIWGAILLAVGLWARDQSKVEPLRS